jgi:hypothetical protein
MRSISLGLAFAATVTAISEISITGSKFFNAEGEQVFWKGISFHRIVLTQELHINDHPTIHSRMRRNVNSTLPL